jgi:hypothetical protein
VNNFADKIEKMMVHQNFHKIKVDARKEDEMEAMKKELSKSISSSSAKYPARPRNR